MNETEQYWVKTWLVDFYDVTNHTGDTLVVDGKPMKPIETVEIERAYAPTRWAKNHVMSLRRKLKGAEVTYVITLCG